MPARFRTIDLAAAFNAPDTLRRKATKTRPAWQAATADAAAQMPRGKRTFWGIPFRLGAASGAGEGMIELAAGTKAVEVPLRGCATHVCFLHFCDGVFPRDQYGGAGEALAEYVLCFEDGTEHVVPVRRRFEVHMPIVGWGASPFASQPAEMPRVMPNDPTKFGWGQVQTGTLTDGSPFRTYVYALENPCPEAKLKSLRLNGTAESLVGVLGVTLYHGPGNPLRHVPRKVYRLVLPAEEAGLVGQVSAELDMGVVVRMYAVPGMVPEEWLTAEDAGLGIHSAPPAATNEFILEATGAEGAVLTVASAAGKHAVPFGPAFHDGASASADGKARIEVLNLRTTWVHVTVLDESTGQPTPTRAHFRGRHGEYIAPYGHHSPINEGWFEDYGGDLQLGQQSFAYVHGKFQLELPVGEVYVELNKGFEYQPLRQRLDIQPGQRELTLQVSRAHDWRKAGWVTADTHVHFISPDTAALEGKAEGLNLINLLASQWGHLYTNVGDITGAAAGCSDEETMVWVGTENRNHLLGHISMLGTHGDPVFPMCAGGADEAYLGDPDVVALTEWARTCKEREGVVVRPHFPSPICEEPVYMLLGELDAAELRQFASPDAGTLDEFCFREWYRYLNCGCRVAAVGGTDKMSAGMPVGGVRTYAQLDPKAEFSFESWGAAVRGGRTFTTSGPLIDMAVDGQPIGGELAVGPRGGTLEIRANATSVWPIHAIEIVVNGKVVADSRDQAGAKALSVRHKLKVTDSCWIAARCGSRLQASHCWPIHLGAHTSPVYVVCGGQELFSPSDATYMLTLLDGGMTYLDTLSVRYSDERHNQIKAIYSQAKHVLEHRMGVHHHH